MSEPLDDKNDVSDTMVGCTVRIAQLIIGLILLFSCGIGLLIGLLFQDIARMLK